MGEWGKKSSFPRERAPSAARIGLLLGVIGFAGGCGRSDVSASVAACIPGDPVACGCRAGLGVQRCSADGTHLLACECTSPATGGGGGGSGGSPNSAGSGAASSGGQDPVDCPVGFHGCGRTCVELETSALHCGACDVACDPGEVCANGRCQESCGPHESRCGDAGCADLRTSAEHCGTCGLSCAGDEICTDGACDCPNGFTRCGSECVDLFSDDAHCGACGSPCAGSESCAFGSCGEAAAGWSTLGFDMQRGGVSTEEQGVPPLTSTWSRSIAGTALNPVVVERGRVIVSGNPRFEDDGPIFALSAADGEELWSYDFGEVSSLGQATVLDGRVYVQHGKGAISLPDHAMIHCLDAVSGRQLWGTVIDAQWDHYWAPAVSSKRVYANGGTFGGLYGFDRETGAELFFSDALEQYDDWAPTIASSGILTMTEGILRTHHAATGAVLSTISMEWDWRGWSMETLVPERDGVAYAVAPPSIYAYRLDGAFLEWGHQSNYSSFPAVSASHVYILDGGELSARWRSTGTAAWSFAGDAALTYPPVVAAGYVYVASAEHTYAIDASSGDLVWQTDVGGWLTVAARRLFVARADGVLSVYTLTDPS